MFVRVADPSAIDDVDVFANRRLDLELVCIPSEVYFDELATYFAPIRALAWVMTALIAVTVVFTGANTLNTAVQDRMSELATWLRERRDGPNDSGPLDGELRGRA